MHVIVPGAWSVHAGHQLRKRLEADIREILPGVTMSTHLESLDDPASWDDVTLDRESAARGMSEGTGM
jgi:divalent metal cation (Fe/Co/Zn/Cd) transporter